LDEAGRFVASRSSHFGDGLMAGFVSKEITVKKSELGDMQIIQ
jgi:hypothetical protein